MEEIRSPEKISQGPSSPEKSSIYLIQEVKTQELEKKHVIQAFLEISAHAFPHLFSFELIVVT